MLLCYMFGTIWTVLLTAAVVSGDADPCTSGVYHKLPNLESRYDFYNTNGRSVNQDSGLITGWYYTGTVTMLSHPPHDNWACGTKYPLWQKASPSLAVNEDVEVVVCYFGFHEDCEEMFFIRKKLCPGDYYVYRLVPTRPDSAYCFGEGNPGIAPTYTPSIGLVSYGIQKLVNETAKRPYTYTEVYFTCHFVASKTEELWYRVYWYLNAAVLYTSRFGKTPDDIVLRLTEPLFVANGFKLGNEISCKVQAFNEEDGPPGPHSARSQPFYAGIVVLTPTLNFEFGDEDTSKRTIRLQRTIPVGCLAEDKCSIELLTTIPEGTNAEQCSILTLEGRRCGVEIQSEGAVNQEINITVSPADVGQYTDFEIYNEVHLRVAETANNKIWNNYSLEPIGVHMTSSSKTKQRDGARCDANNDPHMRTFDLLYYELQNRDGHAAGVYTLYHNERFSTKVQLQVAHCNGVAFCNCGVAALAGQDVFYIDYCDGGVDIDYKSCGDKILKVKSYKELKYEIYFPYGTYVEVYIQKIYGTTFLGVHVQPSIYDVGKTSGLCGTLDGNKTNDFTDKNGNIVNRDQFLESWSLSAQEIGENMLDRKFDLTSLTPMEINVCICTKGLNDGTALRSEISCERNAVASCRKGKDTSKDRCQSLKGRKRRSVQRNPKKPKVTVRQVLFRSKKETVTWTRESAEIFCTQYMEDYPVYSVCEQVQNARPEGAIQDCVEDIMLTGGTDWASISQETMRSTCESELSRNTSLWTSKYNTTSIAETIQSMACINNCSQQGDCINGECNCLDPYVGSDCSVDKRVPPEMHGLLDDGLCDEREIPCTDAHFFAYPLIDSPNLTCHLSKRSILLNGVRKHIGNHTVAAEFSTITEGLCPLDGIYSKRDTESNFVYAYNIGVSYDGTHVSNGTDLYIFDSTCQNTEEIAGEITFSLLEDFCFIEGECVAHEQSSMLDNCLICNTTLSLESWSPNIHNANCVSTSTSPKVTTTPDVLSVTSSKSPTSDVPVTPSSPHFPTSGAHSQQTPSAISTSTSSKSTTPSSITSEEPGATKTELKATESMRTYTANPTTKSTLSTKENSDTSYSVMTGTGTHIPESTVPVVSDINSTTISAARKRTSNTGSSTINPSPIATSTNIISPTQSSNSIHTYKDFQTTKSVSSSKEDRQTQKPSSTKNGSQISESTVAAFSEAEIPTTPIFRDTGSSTSLVDSTQSSIDQNSTPSSTDNGPSTQSSEKNLWIIGAIVPSVIVLAIIIVVGVLLCIKKSNSQLRIQSTTNGKVDQFTGLSRQNTSTSLSPSIETFPSPHDISSKKLFSHAGYFTSREYYPPFKPGLSDEGVRSPTPDTTDDRISESWPNVFKLFYASKPPSATEL